MSTYIFKIYYDVLIEMGITTPNIQVEPVEFGRIVLSRNTELTKNQINAIKTKITNFYNLKFNLTTANVLLDSIIK